MRTEKNEEKPENRCELFIFISSFFYCLRCLSSTGGENCGMCVGEVHL